jgi:lysophospholipase L1-like esterase
LANVICFGDSITRGENDIQHGGWADRLKAHYINRRLQGDDDSFDAFNMGISGETTAGLIDRFSNELLTRLSADGSTIVLFQYGANDAARRYGQYAVEEKSFIRNLSACIELAQSHETHILLIDILPIADHLEGQENANGNTRTTTLVNTYNQHLLALAEKHGVDIIRVSQAFSANKEQLLSPDGLHPNSQGHELLFETIKLKLAEIEQLV